MYPDDDNLRKDKTHKFFEFSGSSKHKKLVTEGRVLIAVYPSCKEVSEWCSSLSFSSSSDEELSGSACGLLENWGFSLIPLGPEPLPNISTWEQIIFEIGVYGKDQTELI